MDYRRNEEEFSRIISTALDNEGYSYLRIFDQRESIRKKWKAINPSNENVDFYICGSQAEGIEPLTLHKEFRQGPYLDVFGVTKKIIAVDESVLFRDIQDITLLELDRGPDVSPGHAVLKLVNLNSGFMTHRIARSAQLFRDSHLLSSQMFLLTSRKNTQSIHFLKSIEYTPIDNSFGFQCFCPAVWNKWKRRSRVEWPSKEDIQKVTASEGILVPSGARDSASKDVEWRISFTKAEKILMMSLNPACLKVHILLRMLFKSEPRISSYQLKTAVFWMAETTPRRLLQEGTLLTHVLRILLFLKMCLDRCYMPNYFNPSWNILTSTKATKRGTEPLQYVKCLIAERGNMFFRIDGITGAMIMLYKQLTPHDADQEREQSKHIIKASKCPNWIQ